MPFGIFGGMKTSFRYFPFTELTLLEVVRLSGFPYSTVWRHTSGKRKISAEAALVYEQTLGVPREKLRPDLWPPEETLQEAPATQGEVSHASQ